MATKEERQLLAQMAGTTLAFWYMNSELKNLFNKALDKGYTPDRLLAEAKNTKWYKRYSESARKAQALEKQDPAEFRRRVQVSTAAVKALAAETGVPIANLHKWARVAFVEGWSEAELRQRLYGGMGGAQDKRVTRTIAQALAKGSLGGEVAQAAQTLRQYADAQGIRWSNNRLAGWLQDIAAGTGSVERVQQLMQKEAASAFPGLRDDIMQGATVRDLASSYIQSYAELLELDPDTVNLYNNDIRSALNAKGQDGKFSPLALGEFETKVRKSKKWLKTQNAQDSVMEAAHGVLQAFGVTW